MGIRELVIFACIFSSCAKTPEHVKKCDQVAKEFAVVMEEEEGFVLLGSGGIYAKNTIDQIYIDFEVVRDVSSVDAENLIEKTARRLIKHLEEKKGFSAYLTHAPLSIQEISISIGFIDEKRNPREKIAQIALYDGKTVISSYKKSVNEYTPEKKEPTHF